MFCQFCPTDSRTFQSKYGISDRSILRHPCCLEAQRQTGRCHRELDGDQRWGLAHARVISDAGRRSSSCTGSENDVVHKIETGIWVFIAKVAGLTESLDKRSRHRILVDAFNAMWLTISSHLGSLNRLTAFGALQRIDL
jgi:hypothetical protein